MIKGLNNINNELPTPLQLSAVKFVEEITGFECPTPLTVVNIEAYLSSYLGLANELYFMEGEDFEDYPTEWEFVQ